MTNRQAQRQEARDRKRIERQQARRASSPTTVQRPMPRSRKVEPPPKKPFPWVWSIVGVVALVLVGVGAFFLFRNVNAPLPGQKYPAQGNDHINPGQPHPPYDSNPPTSGWHYPTWPKPGIYTQALPEEYALHFEEHAGVVIHYNPKKLPSSQVTQLQAIAKSEVYKGHGLVLMMPDPSIPQPIALTAWQYLDPFTTVTGNKSKIETFIERLQCHYDPEGVCGPQHGSQFYPTGTPAPGAPTVIGQPIGAGVPTATPASRQVVETQTPPPAATP